MNGFTHMLVGGAVGAATGSPLSAAASAFISHFVLDLIPHNDYIYYYWNRWKYIYLSPLALLQLMAGGSLIFFFGLTKAAGFLIIIGGLFGLLPDLLTGTLVISGRRHHFFNRLHYRLHHHSDLGEVFYRHFSGGTLLAKNGKEAGQENWRRIKATGWGNFGWGIELAFEALIVVVALRFILKS